MTDQALSKAEVRAIAAAAQEALNDVASKFGMTATVGGGSYDPTTGTFKPRVTFEKGDAAQKGFAQVASLVGLEADDFGKEIILKGTRFKITGINLRAPKFPINIANVKTGRTMKATEATVQRALGREVTAFAASQENQR